MLRKSLKLTLLGAFAAVAFAVPAASAECQDPAGDGSVLVCTTGDPTTGSFGVGVHADPLNVCVVVFETCP